MFHVHEHVANLAWARACACACAGGHAHAHVHVQVANLAWACAVVNPDCIKHQRAGQAPATQRTSEMFTAITTRLAGRLNELDAQALAKLAWSYAVVDHHDADEVFGPDSDFVELCEKCRWTAHELSQLHQWQMWTQSIAGDEKASSVAYWPQLSPALRARSYTAFTSHEGAPSRMQRDVTNALADLGTRPREEVRVADGWSIDVMATHRGVEVAIEVDGPTHFIRQAPTGATAFKRRMVSASGVVLISIPYWEWADARFNGGPKGQRRYLRDALDGAVDEIKRLEDSARRSDFFSAHGSRWERPSAS